MQCPDLLRLKREMFHIEIRRKDRESTFSKSRHIIKSQIHYPIEAFSEMIEKIKTQKFLTQEEYTIINSILDDIQNMASTDPTQFTHYAEHWRIINSLLDSMQLGDYPQIALKASKCFQIAVAQKNQKIYVDEHLDKAYTLYRKWMESSLFEEDGIKGLKVLVNNQHVHQIHDQDLIEQMLQILNDRSKSTQHGKLLNILSDISKDIQDDSQVIRILRMASKLVTMPDQKQKIKGLRIIMNATKNIQNIQFAIHMQVLSLIFELVTYQDPIVVNLSINIICNLTFTIDKEECKKLLEVGIIDVLIKLFKNQKAAYRQNAGFILANLMASDYEIIEKIIENQRLMDLIFQLMYSDVVTVRREITHAWKNFILSGTQQQLQAALNQGLLDFMIEGLYDQDPCIICSSLENISNCIKAFSGSQIESDIYAYLNSKQILKQIDLLQSIQHDEIYKLSWQFIKDHYDSEFY